MDGIREFLTDICLVGAAVFSAAVFSVAWVVLVNRGRLAQAGADAGPSDVCFVCVWAGNHGR